MTESVFFPVGHVDRPKDGVMLTRIHYQPSIVKIPSLGGGGTGASALLGRLEARSTTHERLLRIIIHLAL